MEKSKALPLQSDIAVAWSENFGGRSTVERAPQGLNIREIVERFESRMRPGFSERGFVCVNGDVVPREMWGLVRPRAGTDKRPIVVTLHYAMGKSPTLRIVAQIAVLIASFAAGPFGPLVAIGGDLEADVLGHHR